VAPAAAGKNDSNNTQGSMMKQELALLAALLLALIAAVPQVGSADDRQVSWETYNNTYSAQRFSPLKEINRANIGSLNEICELQLGPAAPFQAGPVVIGDTIFLTLRHITAAVGATDCAVKWYHSHEIDGRPVSQTSRGVAYYKQRIFRGTNDGFLLALDAATGKQLWSTKIKPWWIGEFLTAAPIAWNDLVFIGTGGGDFGIRGRIMAFNASTGEPVWNFYTIPIGNQPGADSWKRPGTAAVGGGGVWGSFTLQPSAPQSREAELFVSVANPSPDYAWSERPGDNLYTDSVVVLDANSGRLKWHFQATANDGLDYDLAAAPMVYGSSGGRKRLAAASKDGYLYVVDQASRQLIFKAPVTTVTGDPARRPTAEPALFCPGPAGGVLWNGPAFDAENKAIIVGAVDDCMTIRSGPAAFRPGEVFMGTSALPGGANAATGWITAVDSEDGRVLWKTHLDSPVVAAVTPTAGGVVFSGDSKGNFLTLDARTGDILRSLPTGGQMAGGVVSYAVDGKQYIAATSGNLSHASYGVAGKPKLIVMSLTREAVAPRITSLVVPLTAADLDRVGRGGKLYSQYCAGCHGTGGEGHSGPALRETAAAGEHPSVADAIKRPPGHIMPTLYPESLSQEDVVDVASFVETLRTGSQSR